MWNDNFQSLVKYIKTVIRSVQILDEETQWKVKRKKLSQGRFLVDMRKNL